jgi:hypothetical protein
MRSGKQPSTSGAGSEIDVLLLVSRHSVEQQRKSSVSAFS